MDILIILLLLVILFVASVIIAFIIDKEIDFSHDLLFSALLTSVAIAFEALPGYVFGFVIIELVIYYIMNKKE